MGTILWVLIWSQRSLFQGKETGYVRCNGHDYLGADLVSAVLGKEMRRCTVHYAHIDGP
jgi:hypothetical protein